MIDGKKRTTNNGGMHPAPGPRVLAAHELASWTQRSIESVLSALESMANSQHQQNLEWPSNVVTIMGDRGAGKSTLLRTILFGRDPQNRAWLNEEQFLAVQPVVAPSFMAEGESFVLSTLALIQGHLERKIVDSGHQTTRTGINPSPSECAATIQAWRVLMRHYAAYDQAWVRASLGLEAHLEDHIDEVKARYSNRLLGGGALDAWLDSFLEPDQMLVLGVDDIDIDPFRTWEILWHIHGPLSHRRVAVIICLEPEQTTRMIEWELRRRSLGSGRPSTSWSIRLTGNWPSGGSDQKPGVNLGFAGLGAIAETRDDLDPFFNNVVGDFIFKVLPPPTRVSLRRLYPRERLMFPTGSTVGNIADLLERCGTKYLFWFGLSVDPNPRRMASLLPDRPRGLDYFFYFLSRHLREAAESISDSAGISPIQDTSQKLSVDEKRREAGRYLYVLSLVADLWTRTLKTGGPGQYLKSMKPAYLLRELLNLTAFGLDITGPTLGTHLSILHDDLGYVGALHSHAFGPLAAVLPPGREGEMTSRWLEAMWDVCLYCFPDTRMAFARHWRPAAVGLEAARWRAEKGPDGWFSSTDGAVSLAAFLDHASAQRNDAGPRLLLLPDSMRGVGTLLAEVRRVLEFSPLKQEMAVENIARHIAWALLLGLWRAVFVASRERTGLRYDASAWRRYPNLDAAVIGLEADLSRAASSTDGQPLANLFQLRAYTDLLVSDEGKQSAERIRKATQTSAQRGEAEK